MWTSNQYRFSMIAFAIAMTAAFVIGCDEDSNNNDPPATGTLTGNVIFHGAWPDTGTVQLSIFENWNTSCWWCAQSAGGPPSYYTVASHFQDPDPANASAADTLSFEITGITLGDYDVVVVGWRNPAQSGNVECDEPVIGMLGAVPGTADTIPEAITFSQNAATQTIEVHVWFERRLPVAGCDDFGRIEGTINFTGEWPTGGSGGVAAIISSAPYTAWQGDLSSYLGRSAMTTPDNLFFSFSQPYGTYYISFWTNVNPPNHRYLGAYGVFTNVSPIGPQDAVMDPVVVSADEPHTVLTATSISAPPPHYVSGTITFTGERPAVGLAVALSPTPQLMGPPSGWYVLDATETVYALTHMPDGSYYVLLYEAVSNGTLYGGYDADSDGDADPLVFDGSNLGYLNINISN